MDHQEWKAERTEGNRLQSIGLAFLFLVIITGLATSKAPLIGSRIKPVAEPADVRIPEKVLVSHKSDKAQVVRSPNFFIQEFLIYDTKQPFKNSVRFLHRTYYANWKACTFRIFGINSYRQRPLRNARPQDKDLFDNRSTSAIVHKGIYEFLPSEPLFVAWIAIRSGLFYFHYDIGPLKDVQSLFCS